MEVLTLSHVAKSFGSRQILRDVSFSVAENTVFGFVGQNGAGKTTTMKLILGLLTCERGEITVGGQSVQYGNGKTNRLIGYLPDVPEFYGFMTPMEYLMFCGDVSGMDKRETDRRSHELLELVGLAGLGKEKRRVKGFSRGMKQRLGVAQALLHRPKLLICDEPTSALDPAGRRELLDLLVAVKEETTVVFSTHILSDVEHICDEVALLHEGVIALQGSLAEVKKLGGHPAMELELERKEDGKLLETMFPCLENQGRKLLLKDGDRLPEILAVIGERRIPFLRMERQETNLEDLFLEVIGR
ncbi:MAG: ABC transporter ATP-binding protein [Firmicutes bacterium]|nr:ABC transporter ATP-binding protein [Bacillota bacterium]